MKWNKKKEQELLAPADGRAIALSNVPDEAFATGILGVGVAIEPAGGTISSPVDGVLEGIAKTAHAFTLHTDDGLDVLVHIGIDTVKMNGKAFLPMVKEGYRVKAGDVLARADLDAIREAGLSTLIPIVVTNPECLSSFETIEGEVEGGKTVVLCYRTY